jgi:ASC-1-like (ASCH) protein
MKKVITFTSKFNVGDIVTYDDKITKPFTSTIIDIKFTDSYQYMYKIEGINGIWYTDRYLSNDTKG